MGGDCCTAWKPELRPFSSCPSAGGVVLRRRSRTSALGTLLPHTTLGPAAAMGREYQFAASGSSRWPDRRQVVGLPVRLNALKGKFGGTADSRSLGRPRSGIGARSHSPASPDRQQPVSGRSSALMLFGPLRSFTEGRSLRLLNCRAKKGGKWDRIHSHVQLWRDVTLPLRG